MFVKLQQGKLFSFIHYQRYMGLTDIDYSNIFNYYEIRGNFWSFSIQFLMLIIFMFTLLGTLGEKSIFYLDMQSSTGNNFHHILIVSVPIIQLLIYIWLRSQQESQRVLLQSLTHLAGQLNVNTLELSLPRWLFRLWIGIAIFYAGNTVFFYNFYWTKNIHLGFRLSVVAVYLHLMRVNFIITCYTTLVYVAMVLFEAQTEQLNAIEDGARISLMKLANNLCMHDELLLLCCEQIVQLFGGTLVFINLYSVLDATCICYVAALEERFSVLEVIFIFSWLLPLCFYLSMPLIINNLARQVSDTNNFNIVEFNHFL